MKNEKIFQKKSSYYILRTLLTHKEDPSPLYFLYENNFNNIKHTKYSYHLFRL